MARFAPGKVNLTATPVLWEPTWKLLLHLLASQSDVYSYNLEPNLMARLTPGNSTWWLLPHFASQPEGAFTLGGFAARLRRAARPLPLRSFRRGLPRDATASSAGGTASSARLEAAVPSGAVWMRELLTRQAKWITTTTSCCWYFCSWSKRSARNAGSSGCIGFCSSG